MNHTRQCLLYTCAHARIYYTGLCLTELKKNQVILLSGVQCIVNRVFSPLWFPLIASLFKTSCRTIFYLVMQDVLVLSFTVIYSLF